MDHQAFAQLLGNYGEFIGAIAVVATLIYFAKQMTINTSAINQTAIHSTLMGRAESLRFLASDPEISAVWWKGAFSPDELDEDEWKRYFLLLGSMLRPIEIAFLDYQAGRMSDDLWQAQDGAVTFWARGPGFQRFFEQYGQTFHPKFQMYVRTLIKDKIETDEST